MKIKRLCAAFLAAVVCMSVFSTTAFAYTDETAASSAETVETAPAETTEQETEEVPYSVSVDEDCPLPAKIDRKKVKKTE